MNVGIGYANDADGRKAGRQVAREALRSGNLNEVDLVIAFCSGALDPEAFFQGLREEVGDEAPIIGGSAFGVITSEQLSYDGFPAAAALVESDHGPCVVAAQGALDVDAEAAGRGLALQLREHLRGQTLLLFYDSIRQASTATHPPVLNSSAPILRGVEQALPSPVRIVGAGLVGDISLTPSWQYCGDTVQRQTLVGAVLPPEVGVHCRITHGCTPLDGVYHVITGIEGAVLRELDGQPVVRLIDELYGNSDWQQERPVGFLTIGVNHGERHGAPLEECYVNRLITGVLPDRSGVALFEPDLELGTEIQFMLRDASMMADSARRGAQALTTELRDAGKVPLLGLYIDCAGRAAVLSNTLLEEAGEVQQVFAEAGVALLGFYSGVEIAPLLEKNRGLDWTGVLVVLTDDGEADG